MGRPVKRKTDTREQALGAVITELRLKKGMTGQDVAEKVAINDGRVYEIENGKQNPTFRVLQAIERYAPDAVIEGALAGRGEVQTATALSDGDVLRTGKYHRASYTAKADDGYP